MRQHYLPRVPPFGHPRIKACKRLPGAFRSLLRPSSPASAKASTVCPSALDHLLLAQMLYSSTVVKELYVRQRTRARAFLYRPTTCSSVYGPAHRGGNPANYPRNLTAEPAYRWVIQDKQGSGNDRRAGYDKPENKSIQYTPFPLCVKPFALARGVGLTEVRNRLQDSLP
jgi:hypothetical protein